MIESQSFIVGDHTALPTPNTETVRSASKKELVSTLTCRQCLGYHEGGADPHDASDRYQHLVLRIKKTEVNHEHSASEPITYHATSRIWCRKSRSSNFSECKNRRKLVVGEVISTLSLLAWISPKAVVTKITPESTLGTHNNRDMYQSHNGAGWRNNPGGHSLSHWQWGSGGKKKQKQREKGTFSNKKLAVETTREDEDEEATAKMQNRRNLHPTRHMISKQRTRPQRGFSEFGLCLFPAGWANLRRVF